MGKEAFVRSFARLFSKAGLRTTEVAAIIDVDRTTISKWKNTGDINCHQAKSLIRLQKLILAIEKALATGELPLDRRGVTGKNERLAALYRILRKYAK